MIGLAAILATAVSVAVAIPLAFGAEYLSALPDTLQMIALVGGVAVYMGFWFLAFNFICKILKVSK